VGGVIRIVEPFTMPSCALGTPPLILALDERYEDFLEVSDEEVIALLSDAATARATGLQERQPQAR
jgi:hypothetical protein